MTTVRRTYTYLLALAGLLVTVTAGAGMFALILTTLTLQSGALLSGGDVRTRASLYLAELVVGLPVWIGHWLAAERSLERHPEERRAPQRRLFLAAVFAITSVVALVALHDLLRVIFTLPAGGAPAAWLAAAIGAATRFLAFGAAWLAYARLDHPRTTIPSDGSAADRAHDLAVYVLTGVALAFLLTGIGEAILHFTDDLLGAGRQDLLSISQQNLWTIWGSIAAWTVAGGSIWALVWQYDLARTARHDLRALYLYVVLAVAVPVTLTSGADGLYEFIRRLFGYQSPTGYREFLPGVLATLLAGGATWIYHWSIVRRQARFTETMLDTAQATREAGPSGATAQVGTPPAGSTAAIAWPQRPGLALLALLGLAAAAPAFISLLWLGLDYLLNSGASLSGPDWWRDRLSISLAAGAVGTGTWLSAWRRLQRAAISSTTERAAQERRLLLGFVTLAGALATFGFSIALLWLAFRALLGAPLGPHGLSTALKEFSGAGIALLLATYHGLMLRADMQVAPARSATLRVRALATPGSEALLSALRQQPGLQIDVAGQLLDAFPGEQLQLPALVDRLAAVRATGESDQILLLLSADGGAVLRYRNTSQE